MYDKSMGSVKPTFVFKDKYHVEVFFNNFNKKYPFTVLPI